MTTSTLDWIASLGGSYEKSSDGLVLDFSKVELSESDCEKIRATVGVVQVALRAAPLSFETLLSIAQMRGLSTLVLVGHALESEQYLALEECGPEVGVLDEE